MGTALPNLGSSNALSPSDDPTKKFRKPYTISKSRESWTEPEHDKFLEALHLFDRDWKKIKAFVGSKTAIQIRSHAQKYFLKVQKNGTNEHLPPPRPKRKAAHPYPLKRSKSALSVSPMSPSFHASPSFPDLGLVRGPEFSSLPSSPVIVSVSSWTDNTVQTGSLSQMKKGNMSGTVQPKTNNYCSSSNESTPRLRSTVEVIEGMQESSIRGKYKYMIH
ncbi:hypothetical protein HAX54_023351 [Datura stramonium]|uniref:Uncharacterized protein n=1 Tax=Datura stramonium TaxID=4076 RepID=A0ABS8UYI6_DATST|nr:hypothetical protein [Datura stramonium]